ncbi:ribosome biogenesis GTPase Der [Acidicapsa acidisoli]|uniref:ribosome biogenesis GTPase Der n=1 Tax=Acidicapsa acidisoli TaxID=1615681 RepID=UPI0021E047D9|nr:ribosome biogenesis GTPase Der [Acidicapsa acidisoli]
MSKYHKSVVPSTPASSHLPLVAIVGRPNVGKSTLFNRLTHSRRSIVGDEPGITRDRIYGDIEWDGRIVRLVDTGGIITDDKEYIPSEIYRQARVALEEADLLLMVVDARTELASPDFTLAKMLIRGGKPVYLVANKVENPTVAAAAENLRQLGLPELFLVSSEHGLGIGDLLDAIFDRLPAPAATGPVAKDSAYDAPLDPDELDIEDEPVFDENEEDELLEDMGPEIDVAEEDSGDLDLVADPREFGPEEDLISEADTEAEIVNASLDGGQPLHRTHGEYEQHETSVAIIGRPNVGKSTLLNALTGTSRAIVSPIAGTTRDAVDEVIEHEGQRLRLIDTAGIRRKGKTHLMAEKLSVVMARRHLESCDVALLMIDAIEGVTANDAHIGGYAHESGRSVIIVINKWDLLTTARTDGKPPADKAIYEEQVRHALKYLSYAPVVFISAASGTNLAKVMKEIKRVAAQRRKRVTTGQMNRFLDKIDFQRAPVPMAKRIRIFYMTQAAVAPPTFVLFTDRNIQLHFAFQRFLENQIREAFGFEGTPIWFKVRARNAEKK